MVIELLQNDTFVDLNKLKEVKSPVLFQRGTVPHPEGLISNEIFGITTKDRKETWAYINLNGHYFSPHMYKVVRFLFGKIDTIIDGSAYYSIDKNGILVPDEAGETGIKFLYENWNKLKWVKSESRGMRNERIDLLNSHKRDEIFITKLPVIPAFYRDITTTSGGGETTELNNMYANIIRYASASSNDDVFNFASNAASFSIQYNINSIYEYFKTKLEKKNGMIRKYLMGKSVDNSVRAVITSPTFHANTPEELFTSFQYAGVPVAQLCSLLNPYVVNWLKDFFDREFIQNKFSKSIYDKNSEDGLANTGIELVNPESYFTEKYIRKLVQRYIKNPESRFDLITVPTTKGDKPIVFRGQVTNTSTLVNRPMTVTDLLYMCTSEVSKGKHILLTRYPLLDAFGIFVARIKPIATYQTETMTVNGIVYEHYPKIPDGLNVIRKETITAMFIDAVQFSNAALPGLDGDYDGDQVTCKVVYSIEANAELEKLLKSKKFYLTINGDTIRNVEIEPVQTFYTMTKNPDKDSKALGIVESKWLLSKDPKFFTFDVLVKMFGKLADNKQRFTDDDEQIMRMNLQDKINCKYNNSSYNTTVGRYLFNLILFKRNGLDKAIPFIDEPVTDSVYKKIEGIFSNALLTDVIDTDEFVKWIDVRDWLGFQLHSVITTSFSMNTLKVPKEVTKLKKELITKYKKELDNGDLIVANTIEKALINKIKETHKGDFGMDLYDSGARGSVSNNLKNMQLMRGPVKNTATGKYDIMLSSLDEGMSIRDIAASSNNIVAGAYPKAVGTVVSGAMAKELLAAFQTEVLDVRGSDCGTLATFEVMIPKDAKGYKDYIYRYIQVGSKLVMLTNENITSFIGKKVKMRSPMGCISPKLCNKCMGDKPYMTDIENVGLFATRVATKLTQLNMKKFHDSTISLIELDIDDLLI